MKTVTPLPEKISLKKAVPVEEDIFDFGTQVQVLAQQMFFGETEYQKKLARRARELREIGFTCKKITQ